jgi:hypothetical protein
MKLLRRWAGVSAVWLAALLLAGMAAPSGAATPGATTPSAEVPVADGRRAVELTFLKSLPGERENLKSFIALNWFAMDKIAKEQGLMQAYTVLDTGSDEGAWNVLVSVTYSDARGYVGIVDAFERIRRAHRTVLVDGKGLRELGRIVESKKTYEDAGQRSS